MGCHATSDGLSVQLYDAENKKYGKPVYGLYARMFGKKREDVVGGGQLTQIENNAKGSAEWLTVVAVADTQARLDDILAKHAVGEVPCLSSGSSHRVKIFIWVDGAKEPDSFIGRTTIASGAVVKNKDSGKFSDVNVTHLKVLALGADPTKEPQLAAEFEGMTHYLELLLE
jgi:hypothetical protein